MKERPMNFDYVVDCTGPWSKFTGDMVGLDVPIWHTKAEAFFLCPPGKKLSYTFPVLKLSGILCTESRRQHLYLQVSPVHGS